MLAARGLEQTLGQLRGGAQRLGPHEPLELLQGLERRARLLELTPRHPGADQQLERRGAVKLALRGRLAQQPLDQLDRPARIALVERQAGPAELRRRQRPRLIEQQRRLLRPGLPPSELGEAGQRASHHRRARAGEVLDRGLQHLLGVRPLSPPEVDRAVLGTAEGEHVAAPVALRELGDPVAPLERALVVENGGAGADQEAAGPGARDRDRRLARQGCRGRLVQAAHALLDPRAGDEGRSLERESEHLEVGDVESPPGLGRAGRELPRPHGVAREVGDVALVEGQPAVLRPRLERLEQALARRSQPPATAKAPRKSS